MVRKERGTTVGKDGVGKAEKQNKDLFHVILTCHHKASDFVILGTASPPYAIHQQALLT